MLSHFFNSLVATLPLAVRNSGGVAVFVRILWVATLLTMSIRAGVIVAVPLHEVNAAPNAKSCAILLLKAVLILLRTVLQSDPAIP